MGRRLALRTVCPVPLVDSVQMELMLECIHWVLTQNGIYIALW